MRGVPPIVDQIADVNIVVPFVHAHVLWIGVARFWALDRNTLQRRLHQSLVVRVGSAGCHSQRNAVPIGQQTPLGSALGTIGWVRPCIFPPQAGPSSSPRPCSATASRFLSGRRIRATPLPTGAPKCLASPTSGNNDEASYRTRIPAAPLSTDSRFVKRRRYRPTPFARGAEAVRPSYSCGNEAAKPPSVQTLHRGGETFHQRVGVPSVGLRRRGTLPDLTKRPDFLPRPPIFNQERFWDRLLAARLRRACADA
jgi:hypothetical protein